MNARLILAAALLATLPLLAGAQTPAPAAPPAAAVGEVTFVTGVATVVAGGETRNLGAGDPVYEGQTITVAANSFCNLKFNDGGRVLLRPNTEFSVESFRYAGPAPAATPAPGPATTPAAAPAAPEAAVAGNAFFRLVRGGFRAVSGLIGQADRAAYRVTTPAATIGIRGTDYEVQTSGDDCPTQAKAAAGYPTEVAASSLAGLELAQAGGGSGGGIIVATNQGSIVLRTSRGDTIVDVGQVALALANGQTFMLPAVPDALLINATPAPADCE